MSAWDIMGFCKSHAVVVTQNFDASRGGLLRADERICSLSVSHKYAKLILLYA